MIVTNTVFIRNRRLPLRMRDRMVAMVGTKNQGLTENNDFGTAKRTKGNFTEQGQQLSLGDSGCAGISSF